MNSLLHFLQYHNAVPIAVGVLMLGAGGVFAATNPEAIYAESKTVLSIDNTYLVGTDLTAWSPRARIESVTEDEGNYYIKFTLATIDLEDYAWKDVARSDQITVSKADLGRYRDLGVYVTQQLRQIIDRELLRLTQTQEIERKSVSLATISTTYSGLVGQMLSDSTDVLPGYAPVVQGPPPDQQGSYSGPTGGGSVSQMDGSASSGGGASLKIGLQVLGNNPARVPLGAAYVDLGAVLIDPYNTNIGVYIFLDGREVRTPSVDTSTSTSYTIEYRAKDPSGTTVVAKRIVLVGGAPDPGGAVSIAGNVNSPPQPEAVVENDLVSPVAELDPVHPNGAARVSSSQAEEAAEDAPSPEVSEGRSEPALAPTTYASEGGGSPAVTATTSTDMSATNPVQEETSGSQPSTETPTSTAATTTEP